MAAHDASLQPFTVLQAESVFGVTPTIISWFIHLSKHN